MAYADQKMSSGKVVAIVIVALIHAALGYAFVTGLAYQYVKKATEKLNTFDVEEPPPPPPDEPPPPPPDTPMQPPPVVSPPPIVQNPNPPPVVIQSVPTPPPTYNPTPIAAPPAPPAPPAPASVVSKAAAVKGDEAGWFTQEDYPPSAQRAGEQGTVGISWTVNAQGRAENCQVTRSSGSSALDDATCRLLVRRARYAPALDQSGNPMSTKKSRNVSWRLPDDR
jgi:protein TonB